MYQVINAAKQNIQEYSIYGTVGNATFDGDVNVVAGSCSYQNQCCATSEFGLGYVYSASFQATFMGLNIGRNSWKGLTITPYVEIDGVVIPVGVFTIEKADHTAGIVAVTAFDNMKKFSKSAAVTIGMNEKPYDWLALACEECNVVLGMTRAEVESLPNGNSYLPLSEMGDIEDWIDVLYWVSVSLGGFATVDRYGELVIKTYHSEVDDTVPADVRYNSNYGDEIITYTGLYVTSTADEKAEYYAALVDNGYSTSIGAVPFFQKSKAMREACCQNILSALGEIEYNPCDLSIPFGCHYDLGDVLSFPDGDGSASNKFCVMYIAWTFGGDCTIKSIPKPTKTKSKADKSIQGLLNNVKTNEVATYETKNARVIDIADNEKKNIISMQIASNTDTKAMIHIEVNLESLANTPTAKYSLDSNDKVVLQDIWDGIRNTAVKGEITYVVNSVEDFLHPVESWIDGKHILHLMYIIGLQQGLVAYFSAYMKAIGGSIHIDRGGVWAYALGVGLVGDGKWDGTISIEENAADFNLIRIEFSECGEVVNFNLDIPEEISVSDSAAVFTVPEISMDSISESITITMHLYSMPRVTEYGEPRITEDNDVRYTEGE